MWGHLLRLVTCLSARTTGRTLCHLINIHEVYNFHFFPAPLVLTIYNIRPGGDCYRGCMCQSCVLLEHKKDIKCICCHKGPKLVSFILMCKKSQHSCDYLKYPSLNTDTRWGIYSVSWIYSRKGNHESLSTWWCFQKVLDSAVLLLWFVSNLYMIYSPQDTDSL